MSLNESTRGNRTYVSIVQGQLAQRVTEDTPRAIKRIIEDKKTKAKREVWELLYGTADGMIEGIEIKEDGSFGDQLNINMSDNGRHFTVSLSMSGREAKAFLCVLNNVDLKQPVTLAPYNFVSKEDGRQVIGLNTLQGGKTKDFKVTPYFSKTSPNGLPQVPEGSDKDEFKLVMKSQEIFLKKWAKKFIAEHFAGAVAESANRMQGNQNAERSFSGDEKPTKKGYVDVRNEVNKNASESDLPFLFDSSIFQNNI